LEGSGSLQLQAVAEHEQDHVNFAQSRSGPPIRSIWGLPVVGTPVMPANQFLVGACYDGAQIFDRMGATLMISTENEDDFIRNLATFLVEERLAMTVRRPQAFIYGAFP